MLRVLWPFWVTVLKGQNSCLCVENKLRFSASLTKKTLWKSTNLISWILFFFFFLHSISFSWRVSRMKFTNLYYLLKWDNVQNQWPTKIFLLGYVNYFCTKLNKAGVFFNKKFSFLHRKHFFSRREDKNLPQFLKMCWNFMWRWI